jgi:hypothetical protein
MELKYSLNKTIGLHEVPKAKFPSVTRTARFVSVYKNTGFQKLILPFVGCHYDLVPGSYWKIVMETAVKVIFTLTSTDSY